MGLSIMRLTVMLWMVILTSSCSVRHNIVPGNDYPLIFILAGQSNMLGTGIRSEMPDEYFEHPNNIKYYSNGVLMHFNDKQTPYFGPEVSFGRHLAKIYPNREIVLIKYAVGGRSIVCWDPLWSKIKTSHLRKKKCGPDANIYPDFIKTVKDILKLYKQYELGSMIWIQGETDSQVKEFADKYSNHLVGLINAIRIDLSAISLPFIYTSMEYEPQKKLHMLYWDIVKNHQIKALRMTKSLLMIETYDLNKDDAHYKSDQLKTLGKRLASAYINIYSF